MNSSGVFYRVLKQETQTINDFAENTADNYKDVEDDDKFEAGKSIQETYSDEEISEKTIVRNENNRQFMVYDSPQLLYKDINEGSSWHEVALAGQRKLYFDIDLSMKDMTQLLAVKDPLIQVITMAPEDRSRTTIMTEGNFSPAAIRYLNNAVDPNRIGYGQYRDDMMNEIVIVGECLARSFMEFIHQIYPNVYILRCDSFVVNPDFQKFSIHIIVGIYAHTSYEIAEVAMMMYEQYVSKSAFNRYVGQFIDMGVYTAVRSLRLTGTTKMGQNKDRVKRLINNLWSSPYEGWRHTLITHIDCNTDRLISIELKKSKLRGDCSEIVNLAHIPDGFASIISPYSEGLIPHQVWGSTVYFRRTNSGHCKLCGRIHEKENSLVVTILENAYIIKCRRNREGRKVVIPVHNQVKLKPIPKNIVVDENIIGGEIVGSEDKPKQMRKRQDSLRVANWV